MAKFHYFICILFQIDFLLFPLLSFTHLSIKPEFFSSLLYLSPYLVLFIYLSVNLSILFSSSIYVSIYLVLFIYLSIYLFLFIYLSISFSSSIYLSIFFSLSIYLSASSSRVIANTLDCDIVVNEFDLQSQYYDLFRTSTLGKTGSLA